MRKPVNGAQPFDDAMFQRLVLMRVEGSLFVRDGPGDPRPNIVDRLIETILVERERVAAKIPLLSLDAHERPCLLAALEATGWSVYAAARLLKIGKTTMYRKMEKHCLIRPPGVKRARGNPR